jgi:multidrug efflux system membrane fusion protein
MTCRVLGVLFGLSLMAMIAMPGCSPKQPLVAPPEAPSTPIAHPVEREVTDYVEFTGRTDAVEAVDVKARVTGFLKRLPFKEGSEVKEGDLLFEIDPRPYQAQYEQALGQVELYKSSLELAKITYKRDLDIARTPGAVSQQQLDQDQAAVKEADARVKAYQASLDIYKLNLEFTQVKSPIDGKISRYYMTKGNLVNQDQTLLTTVVSLDPMYVYFDMDEPTQLKIRRAINAGLIQAPQDGKFFVDIGLQGEDDYPHRGTVNFINNQFNPNTGSISVRALVANPKPPGGIRLMSPGNFARVRVPIGQPHPALLVIDRAIGSEQGVKYVYVIGADNKVEQRRVKIGALQDDGLRVIEKEGSELKADDWVVVGGLQQLRPKMTVPADHIDRVTMPTFNQPVTLTPEKGDGKAAKEKSQQKGK